MNIAAPFCEHAAAAVNARREIHVYLQKELGYWCTMCEACAVLGPDERDLDFLVCCRCVEEWSATTGSDYLERSRDPKDEFPNQP